MARSVRKSDEFGGAAYLFVPWSEEYYREMAETIDRRYAQWKAARRKPEAGEEFRDKARGYKAAAQRLGWRDRVLRERQNFSRRLQDRLLREIQAAALRRRLEQRMVVLAGDEDDEYMDNDDNLNFSDLNTICNYDPEIMPFLTRHYGESLDFRELDGGGEEDEE